MSSFLYPFLLVLHVFVSLFLILLVLVQNDKGGGLAGAFGGMSNAAFTGSGAATIITKTTQWVAIISFAIIIGLNVLSNQKVGAKNVESELKNSSSYGSQIPAGAQGFGPTGGPIEGIPQAPQAPAPAEE